MNNAGRPDKRKVAAFAVLSVRAARGELPPLKFSGFRELKKPFAPGKRFLYLRVPKTGTQVAL
jgi:hypothetical protein